MDLRCPSKKHGEATPDFIEVKCSSRFCGAERGTVVIHRFTHQGELVETLQFKDPKRKDRSDDLSPVRSA